MFQVVNGVKQGRVIISPVMFCVYVDDLLCMLAKLNVGCYIGSHFFPALAHADDIVILAPTTSAMSILHLTLAAIGQCFWRSISNINIILLIMPFV